MSDQVLEKLNEILGTDITLPEGHKFDIGYIRKKSVGLLAQNNNGIYIENIRDDNTNGVVSLNSTNTYKLIVKDQDGDNVTVELDLHKLHMEALIEKRNLKSHKSILELIVDARKLIRPFHDITRVDIIKYFKGTKVASLLTDEFWADPLTQKTLYRINTFEYEPVMSTKLYVNLLIIEALKLPADSHHRFVRSIAAEDRRYGEPKPVTVRLTVTDVNARHILDEHDRPKVIEFEIRGLYPTDRLDVEGFLEKIPEETFITSDIGFPFKLK